MTSSPKITRSTRRYPRRRPGSHPGNKADGHWVFELEADATIPSEYILLNHYLGDIRDDLERQIAKYIRRTQGDMADGRCI